MRTTTHRCKAVVVGTGAGGAVAGTVLAESGIDTLFVEEGFHYKPEDHKDVFTGLVNMYLGAGSTITIGRPPVSITLGRAVGGTTIINSSTCFRPPRKKVESWCGPSYDEMTPYFEEVERRICAAPADIELLGGNWRVLKRGCDALGVKLKPLVHNIKDCAKRGRCQFGCPEGAKQSTEISFIPKALESGARLLTGHLVDSERYRRERLCRRRSRQKRSGQVRGARRRGCARNGRAENPCLPDETKTRELVAPHGKRPSDTPRRARRSSDG